MSSRLPTMISRISFLVMFVTAAIGCDDQWKVSLQPADTKPPQGNVEQPMPGGTIVRSPTESRPTGTGSPSTSSPSTGSVSTGGASNQPLIRLSAGVALPQTGPEGTLMSFSVDYQFTRGTPEPSSTYLWIIERQDGPPVELPVRPIEFRGTMQALAGSWRPEQGPFRARFDEVTAAGSRRPVSASVDLR